MSDCALIIFTKNPELGKVKTRLAKSIGDQAALEIYKKLIDFTQRETSEVGVDLIVYYSLKIEEHDTWVHAEKKVQAAGDLGNKMFGAFKTELAHYKKVCIIGTDCAQLTAVNIQKAFDSLETHDFVLGPANDGGYYLLGMKQLEAKLFEGVQWSTDQVLNQTIDQVNSLNKDFYLLPELIDVDTIEDWEMVKGNFE